MARDGVYCHALFHDASLLTAISHDVSETFLLLPFEITMMKILLVRPTRDEQEMSNCNGEKFEFGEWAL